MQLTKNFNLSEFNCKDGTIVPEYYIANVKRLAENLQVLRDSYNLPIIVNSGYRTTFYNKKIGGSVASYHILAMASDIRILGISPRDLAKRIEKLIKEKKMLQGGLGIYNNFVHYDIRGIGSRWFG